jgi:hypothetical protein
MITTASLGFFCEATAIPSSRASPAINTDGRDRCPSVSISLPSRLLKFVVFGPISGFEDLLVGGPVE